MSDDVIDLQAVHIRPIMPYDDPISAEILELLQHTNSARSNGPYTSLLRCNGEGSAQPLGHKLGSDSRSRVCMAWVCWIVNNVSCTRREGYHG